MELGQLEIREGRVVRERPVATRVGHFKPCSPMYVTHYYPKPAIPALRDSIAMRVAWAARKSRSADTLGAFQLLRHAGVDGGCSWHAYRAGSQGDNLLDFLARNPHRCCLAYVGVYGSRVPGTSGNAELDQPGRPSRGPD